MATTRKRKLSRLEIFEQSDLYVVGQLPSAQKPTPAPKFKKQEVET